MMTYISEEPACLAQILRDYRQKLAAIEISPASTRYAEFCCWRPDRR
jgi:hypothetical protein